MKMFLCFAGLLALLTAAGCVTASGDGSFALGNREFLAGDGIEILHVTAPSRNLQLGDTVTVQGRYVLQSHSQARLLLSITGTGGRTRNSPSQSQVAAAGSGEFELSIELNQPGELHVSFYPVPGGSSFGGVYFEPRH